MRRQSAAAVGRVRHKRAAGTSADATPMPAGQARPWKASLSWNATGLEWAGAPGTATSLFGGRCSVPSDYVISASFTGTATHAGAITGTGSHCSQIIWTTQGPAGATYTDGQAEATAADGSTLALTYGNGTTGVDPETGELWFQDAFAFAGGTGRFVGATGGGQEGGRFASFDAILAGAPVAMWMTGTITFQPGRGKNP